MKRPLILFGVLIAVALLAPSLRADTILLTQSNVFGSGLFGKVDLTMGAAGIIHVEVTAFDGFTIFGNGAAFGFNIAGEDNGITAFNFTSGYGPLSPLGSHQLDGFGKFEYYIEGPEPPNSLAQIAFDLERTGTIFTSPGDLYELSSGGVLMAGHFASPIDPTTGTRVTGWVADDGSNPPIFPPEGDPVPEPSSLILLGSGLAAVGFYIRKYRAR